MNLLCVYDKRCEYVYKKVEVHQYRLEICMPQVIKFDMMTMS